MKNKTEEVLELQEDQVVTDSPVMPQLTEDQRIELERYGLSLQSYIMDQGLDSWEAMDSQQRVDAVEFISGMPSEIERYYDVWAGLCADGEVQMNATPRHERHRYFPNSTSSDGDL